MSRTIRRKGIKYPTGWYSTDRVTFEQQREEYLSDTWRGTYEYYSYHTMRWVTVIRKWHKHDVVEHATFDDYIARRDAIHHSDAGHPVDNHQVNAGFRRMLNRCFRAKQKNELICAIVRGEEDDLSLTPFRHDASWWF